MLGVAFAGVIALGIARDLLHSDEFGVDFHTYLAAAVVGLRDGWSRIYDQAVVAGAQQQLDPHVWAQPFLSTPPMAWLVAPFSPLPYPGAYLAWSVLTLCALAAALAWSTDYAGAARWLAVGAAVVPWWVLHAVHVGQVTPLIAAGVLVSWKLLRQHRDLAAGCVLVLLVLKPNTAVLVPVALLLAGRTRAFAAWLAASGVVAAASLLLIGPGGFAAYANELTHISAPALRGASHLTIAAAFGLTPIASVFVRAVIAAAALAAVYRFRREVGMAMAVGLVASLLVVNYLHASDLCLFLAAGWIVWHERRQAGWRALLGGIWVLANPFLDGSLMAPALDRWVICELLFMAALFAEAFARPMWIRHREALTAWAATGRRATA